MLVLRVAYFVFVHEIPKALVINGDHTGILFTQIRGRTWITKQQAEAKDKNVAGQGDKRQFTLLASISAAGDALKNQVVVEGKGKGSLPKFAANYLISIAGRNSPAIKKGLKQISVCFVLSSFVSSVANIASFCCTANHWSDDITSRAYIKDVVVPYFKNKITLLHQVAPHFT